MDMPPPQMTWILLKVEGMDGEEGMAAGIVQGNDLWSMTWYDGSKKPNTTDSIPLSMGKGWTPVFVPSQPGEEKTNQMTLGDIMKLTMRHMRNAIRSAKKGDDSHKKRSSGK